MSVVLVNFLWLFMNEVLNFGQVMMFSQGQIFGQVLYFSKVQRVFVLNESWVIFWGITIKFRRVKLGSGQAWLGSSWHGSNLTWVKFTMWWMSPLLCRWVVLASKCISNQFAPVKSTFNQPTVTYNNYYQLIIIITMIELYSCCRIIHRRATASQG